MNRYLAIGIVTIFILAIGLSFAFYSNNQKVSGSSILETGNDDEASEKEIGQQTNTISIQEISEGSSQGSVKEFTIIAKKWEFVPDEINVNEGDTVVLNIESVDVEHGISLPAFEISEDLFPGSKVKVQFVANKKGTYSFFCNVYCGSGHSEMKGTLIVK